MQCLIFFECRQRGLRIRKSDDIEDGLCKSSGVENRIKENHYSRVVSDSHFLVIGSDNI